jgi:hypothetical protein
MLFGQIAIPESLSCGVAFLDVEVREDGAGLPSADMLEEIDLGNAGVGPLVGGLELWAGRAVVLVVGGGATADGVEDQ